jgi:uncharacterized iron-regulated protein
MISPLGKRKQELQLADKLGEDSNVNAVKKVRKNKTMKINRSKIKQVHIFTYLGSMVQKNDEIQNEINERTRNATQFYHLIKSILWKKDIESVKP